jgi:AraC family transcriptional regulator
MSTQTDQNPRVGVEPRFENGGALLIVGLRERVESVTSIPAQWQRTLAYKTPKRVGRVDYGLSFNCCGGADELEYLAGFEVSDSSDLPKELSCVSIPAQKYAVFSHPGHVSELHQTCQQIEKWLPQSGYEHVKASDAPDFFERYGEEFDPETGRGDIEIWVPIKG